MLIEEHEVQQRASLLEQSLRKGDMPQVHALLKPQHPADIKEFMQQLPVELWPGLLEAIPEWEKRAEVVCQLEQAQWQRLMVWLQPGDIALLIKHMESDDAADIVGCLSEEKKHLVLCSLSVKERASVLQLLGYPQDSAGGIMQLERAQVSHKATVTDAIRTVRELVEEDVEVMVIWVVDDDQRLIGSCELSDLLLHKSTTRITDIMNADVSGVEPFMDQERVADLFQKYDLLVVPVVDKQKHILGRIVIDDVMDVLSAEADEDALHMAGTSTEELAHPTQVFAIARVRLPWLAVSLGCSLASAVLLCTFEEVLAQAIILVPFISVITAMGGNVAVQSATLLLRNLVSAKSGSQDISQFLLREIKVTLITGTACGLTSCVAAMVLNEYNWHLGIVVFFAVVLGMTASSMVGVLVPTFLRRLGVDPAIASGPSVMTLSDITGIAIYLSIAIPFLRYLQS